jgi:hypothetical protein
MLTENFLNFKNNVFRLEKIIHFRTFKGRNIFNFLKNCAWLIKNSKTNLNEKSLKHENLVDSVGEDSFLECDFELLKQLQKKKHLNLKKKKLI